MSTQTEVSAPEKYEDLQNDPYKKNLENLTNEIKDFKDNNGDNDSIESSVIVENKLDETLKKYLEENEAVTNLIKSELQNIIGDNKIPASGREGAKSLLKLIEDINKPSETTVTPEVKEQQEPKLDLKGELAAPEDGDNKKLFQGLVRDRPAEGSEPDDDELKFYKMVERIKGTGGDNAGLEKKVSDLLSKDNLSNDMGKNLRDIDALLKKINKIIDNTSSNNVKNLQNFISKNLEGNALEAFNTSSLGSRGYDGKFGKGTLKGLNLVLDKIDSYVNSVSTTLDNTKQQETNPDNLNNVEAKSGVKIIKNGEIDPKQWLNGVPEGATVKLKQGENFDKTKEGEQRVTLVVTLGNNEQKEIEVTVEVVENLDPDNGQSQENKPSESGGTTNPTEKPDPLKGPDEKDHPVLDKNTEIVSKSGLEGAVFYQGDVVDSNGEDANGDNEDSKGIKFDENGDFDCLMKLGKEVYHVKLDEHFNLCPTAKDSNGNKILFKNMPTCIAYLQSKAPEGAIIGWHEGVQDYTIKLENGNILTIEPMTIDGKWVSEDLKECLALLNFTNYLLTHKFLETDIPFKGKDPDLKLDDGILKVKVKKGKNRDKWYKVPMERFGLNDIDGEVLKKFIKYNNGEHWEDKWDKKDDNKGYNKIDLPIKIEASGTTQSRNEAEQVSNGSQTVTLGAGFRGRTFEDGDETVIDNTTLPDDVISGLLLKEGTINERSLLNIPNGITVYIRDNSKTDYHPDKDGYYYRNGDSVCRVSSEKPWIKKSTPIEGLSSIDASSWNAKLDVYEGGRDKLDEKLKESLKGNISENDLSKLSISISGGNPDQYQLKNGDITIPLDDEILTKDFCGLSSIEDKLKLVYLASKNVPGEFELDDGNIKVKKYQTDGMENFSVAISQEELSKLGIRFEGDKKGEYVEYLNSISGENLVEAEKGSGDETESTHTEPDQKFVEISSLDMSDSDFNAMNSNLGENMFIEKKEDKFGYNTDKLKKYLGNQRGKERIELKNNVAYILAVQILLNEKAGDGNKIKLDGKYGNETHDRVYAFQENYNNNLPKGGVILSKDGEPGQETLEVLLDGKLGDADFEGLGCYIDGNRDLQLSEDSSLTTGTHGNGKYLEKDGQRYYKWNLEFNGLGYKYYIDFGNIGYIEMGNYVNGEREGKGTSYWANGNKFEGNYKNNKMIEGKFTIKSDEGEKIYDVVRENGLMKIVGPEGDDNTNFGKYIDQNDGGKIIDNTTSS